MSTGEDADDGLPRPAEATIVPPESRAGGAPPLRRPMARGGPRWLVGALAGLLLFVIAAIAAAPFWAPPVISLLPWGDRSQAGLSRRIDALAQQIVAERREAAATNAVVGALSARADRAKALRSSDRQEAAGGQQRLEQQLHGLEARIASQPTIDPAEIARMQQKLQGLGTAAADLDRRVAALEQLVRSDSSASRTDMAMSLALAQIEDAVDRGQPFPAAYAAFAGLAHDQPGLAEAAAPLADAAKTGVPARATLEVRLDDLAGRIATATAPPAKDDWRAETLARLRSLVTIRRIGSEASGPEAAVSMAQQALSRGDLAAAVATLDQLSGPNAAAAKPWLAEAHRRLTAEAALARLRRLLVKRLGPSGTSPGKAARPPGKAS